MLRSQASSLLGVSGSAVRPLPLTNAVLLLLSIVCAVMLAAASHAVLGQELTGVDDANIYMAYGRNIAAGEGFVYYSGGERVEGFTSLAWALITAVAFVLDPLNPERVLFVVATGLVALTLFAALRFLRAESDVHDSRRYIPAGVLCLWCLSSPTYGIWMTTSFMETVLWGFVLCAGTLSFARLAAAPGDRAIARASMMYAASAVIVRPESLLIVPVWIATAWLAQSLMTRRPGPAVRAVLPALVAFAVVELALTAFRLAYFGYPLPNTYYAKLSPNALYNLNTGLRYLRTFALNFPPAALLLTAGGGLALYSAFSLWRHGRGTHDAGAAVRSHARWAVVTISLVVVSALPVLTGGDHFAGGRLLQPVWPLMGLVLIRMLAVAQNPVGSVRPFAAGVMTAVAGSLLLITTVLLWGSDLQPVRHEYTIAARGRLLGRLLNEVLTVHPLPSIGVITAGGVATTYDGPVVDLMGLNNVRMGHSPGERIGGKNHAAFSVAVFWELQPDLVVPHLVTDAAALNATPSWMAQRDRNYLRGLLRTPQFTQTYTLVWIRSARGDFPSFVAFGKRTWLASAGDAVRSVEFDARPPLVRR